MNKTSTIPSITVNHDFISVFSEEQYPMAARGGMMLTEQLQALNLRLRESRSGYKTGWHVAGDPTLILIQQGILRITLRDGVQREFGKGDAFIAKDYLPLDLKFDNAVHGHIAEVIGDQTLKAVHIKLSKI